MTAPRPFILAEANLTQLAKYQPNVAVLPWGATEAHNYHLPHGTDVIEAQSLAEASAASAFQRGARPIVLPPIPYGNDAQQLDQIATISIGTVTAFHLLSDVTNSLVKQGINRLLVLNGHGGNDFKPLIRDIQSQSGALIVLINFYQLVPEALSATFDDPGDHAGEMETSLILHLRPELVEMDQAGSGRTNPFVIRSLRGPGVWTPRPWSATHPDTGCGDPRPATAEKGQRYFASLCEAVSGVLCDLSSANKGDLPLV